MIGRLFLLFTLLPLLELFILIKLGTVIGALPTVLIVVFTGGAGALLARHQGGHVWLRIQRELEQHRFPADDLIDGLMLIVAGALLITPGILTDLAGFSILIPATRRPMREWLKSRLARMMASGNVHVSGFFS